MDDLCKGCKSIQYCPYYKDDLVTEICPCNKCLVKVTCVNCCFPYVRFKNIAVDAKRKTNETTM